MTETVKTWPDLSAAAIEQRCDLSLRLWYILRQHCPDGRGWVHLADIYHLSCGSRRQTRAWLKAGTGTFWTRDGNRYWLAGLGTLSETLDVKVTKPSVYINRSKIENLQRFRAELFKSWFVGRPKTISQKLLGDIFGRGRRTLAYWSKLSGLRVQSNIAWSPLPDEDQLHKFPPGVLAAMGMKDITEEAYRTNAIWLENWEAHPKGLSDSKWQYRKGKKPVLVQMMVNTYHATSLNVGKVTTLQRQAKRRVKTARRHSQAPGSIPAGANGRTPEQRYFPQRGRRGKSKQIARAQQGGAAILETRARHHGRVMWEYQT